MDFQLTRQQVLARTIAREVAETELAPFAREWDAEERFPREALAKLAGLGFMGISLPRQYGGCGLDSISYVLIIEELARACASTAIIVSVHNSVCVYPIWALGTEAQRQRYLPDLASGATLGAFALTEPNAGSDSASIETTATPCSDGFLLNGSKTFITNGGTAGVVIVMARTDPGRGGRGITAFIVEKGREGFSVGTKETKLGIRASDTCELFFDNCRVPAENVLGSTGSGLGAALNALTFGRVGVGAQALGVAGRALQECVRYTGDRRQFGKPLKAFQAIQWMIADMATDIEAARHLIYLAASLKDRGLSFAKEAAMAKLFASEAAMRAATRAVQIHGGYGCMKNYAVERCFRDAKVIEIYEGTSEIQRLIIARNVLT